MQGTAVVNLRSSYRKRHMDAVFCNAGSSNQCNQKTTINFSPQNSSIFNFLFIVMLFLSLYILLVLKFIEN